jgi:hypothetical protein
MMSEEVSMQDGRYRSTLHWAMTGNGFDSVIGAFNYYHLAFKSEPTERVNAHFHVQLFDANGECRAVHQEPLKAGGTTYIRISDLAPGFRGLVAARMVPHGGMGRLSGSTRPIASSYFMMYEREGGYTDFSHELFLPRTSPSQERKGWASIFHVLQGFRPGVVVMNNCPGETGDTWFATVEVQVCDLSGACLTEARMLYLPPGGSRLVMLDEIFPNLQMVVGETHSVVVRGNNIEQPMTMHVSESGDFNFHHF